MYKYVLWNVVSAPQPSPQLKVTVQLVVSKNATECENFGHLLINKHYIAYFSCACTKRPYFYFWSKIWLHHYVPRLRFL